MPELVEHLRKSRLLLCIFVAFLLNTLATSDIPLGSKISVADKNIWISPNGDFAFGFFNRSDQPNYSFGIPDLIIGNNSYAQLTQDGELVLFDSLKGVTAWTSKTRQLSVVSAALNDNGNLVLLNQEKHIVWHSFDTPSDILLPGQSFSTLQTLGAASKNWKADGGDRSKTDATVHNLDSYFQIHAKYVTNAVFFPRFLNVWEAPSAMAKL
ncbi:G-type lectin S-receptor-like serine/threonine-protein kinase SD3-1 [Pyrus ussuriensis x Pyrus communis]|uniref:G-type lectin S-receptor-like serine/threonine-protein kinase SD3-1 n=1 Tax=Pyrus ussuriensis x Pyrus communis TaxID=2448454 RepID=A0A5N5G3E8_9ROSA|nr:G-type lectin S-receptor-like serine/threonine-protein kinase SD3-1 [Pyrus ussuriensis x Pyrus communis]